MYYPEYVEWIHILWRIDLLLEHDRVSVCALYDNAKTQPKLSEGKIPFYGVEYVRLWVPADGNNRKREGYYVKGGILEAGSITGLGESILLQWV